MFPKAPHLSSGQKSRVRKGAPAPALPGAQRTRARRLRSACFCACAALLTGCIQTSQHFRGGKLLAPGETGITLGGGVMRAVEGYDGEGEIDDGGEPGSQDFLTGLSLPQFSLDYRLGLRDRWGPLRGVEIGWHLEVPTNPASASFDLKLGLPRPVRWADFDHALALGWIIGGYADNGLFGEYALSWSSGPIELFTAQRLHRLATPLPDAFADEDELGQPDTPLFQSDPRGLWQGMAGVGFTLPDWILVPDRIAPQISYTAPAWLPNFASGHLHRRGGFAWQWALGLEWRFQ